MLTRAWCHGLTSGWGRGVRHGARRTVKIFIFDGEAGRPQLERALQNRRSGEPTVLLAHHPHVFRHVEKLQVALQLSGHTHGGQVGLLGKSLLSPVYPLIRGHYRTPDQATQLFVSAGLGHWLPFRFGCPPEVVVIELVPA